jgi:hypothetical protein
MVLANSGEGVSGEGKRYSGRTRGRLSGNYCRAASDPKISADPQNASAIATSKPTISPRKQPNIVR